MSARRGSGGSGIGALAAIAPLAGLAVFVGGCATVSYNYASEKVRLSLP